MKRWTAMRPGRRIFVLRPDRIAVPAAVRGKKTGDQPRLCRAMKGRAVGCLIACVSVVTMAMASLGAHHSPVMFDRSVTKTLAGTVVEFAWTNPHSSIQLDVPNDKGGVDRWGVERKPAVDGENWLEVLDYQAGRQGHRRCESAEEWRVWRDLRVDDVARWPQARWSRDRLSEEHSRNRLRTH